MKLMKNTVQWVALGALVISAFGAAGCDDGADGDGAGGGGGEASGGDEDVAPSTGTEPLYAMMVQVYTPDWDRNVYVHLTTELDASNIDLAQAREFGGVANFAGIDGRILVSSGDEPTITEFGISNDLEWTEGRTVSFVGYPFEDNANFYAQYILDDQTAYLPFEKTSRIIWNPADMIIEGTLTDTNVPLEAEGLAVTTGGNRNAIQFEGPVQQPFFYVDADWTTYGSESIVALYDEETNEEEALITLPCPALSMASQDGGYTYYGTWSFMDKALFGEGPEPCIARLDADLTLDEEWTTDLMDVTDGRYHNNFRALGNGKAIANVFHDEIFLAENPDMSFDASQDADARADVVDALYASGPWWKLWLIDIEARTGAPVEGIDVEPSSGAQFAVLDGRTFVFLPYNEWANTKIYEIGDDGVATERGDTVGDVFKWVRIR